MKPTSVNVNVRLDRNVKESADLLFGELGMNLSTALNIFLRQAIRVGKIPFEVADPFVGEKNMVRLQKSSATAERGQLAQHHLIDVAFTASYDGTTQRYVLSLPPTFESVRSHDLLLALHGHGSDRWQVITQMRDECRAMRDFAARHNMLLVSPDYRATTSWMGPAAEADILQIIADLRNWHDITRIFLTGGSMGGTATLIFAVKHPHLLAGAAAMNGTANLVEYQNFSDAISVSYGGTCEEIPVAYRERSAEFYPERLTMPLGLTVSGCDTSVPPDSVRRLAITLQQRGAPVMLLDRPGVGHETCYADALAALEFMLAPSM